MRITIRRAVGTIATAAALALVAAVAGPVAAQEDEPDLSAPVVGVSTLVASGEVPAVTYLDVTFASRQPVGCTGTLVSPRWVLTAAHCVLLQDGTLASGVSLLIGSVDVTTDLVTPGPGVETWTSDGWVVHGDASVGPKWFNDVAMIHLPGPSAITPMPLATDAALVEPASNAAGDRLDATFFGFGLHQHEPGNSVEQDFLLRRGDSTIYSDGFVEDNFGSALLGGFLSEKELNRNIFLFPNLGFEGGGCFGDSGGPMAVTQDGQVRLAGVNSFISANTDGFCDGFVGNEFGDLFLLHAVADLVGTDLGDWVTSIMSAQATCAGRPAEIIGSPRGDILVGTAGANVMAGRGGRDLMIGRGGNDRLCGGKASDLILGGPGTDRIRGEADADDLRGQSGSDDIKGGGGADDIVGGSGEDSLDGSSGPDDIRGDGGDDELAGGTGDDRIRGGSRSDRIRGGPGDDVIDGGRGINTCVGGSGRDTLVRC